jgi:hypothetical protein
MQFEEGNIVRLKTPVRGYRVVTLNERNGYQWIAETSSGMEVEIYEDEIEEKV